MGGGGASADNAECGALDAVFDAYVGGGRATDSLQKSERMGRPLFSLKSIL